MAGAPTWTLCAAHPKIDLRVSTTTKQSQISSPSMWTLRSAMAMGIGRGLDSGGPRCGTARAGLQPRNSSWPQSHDAGIRPPEASAASFGRLDHLVEVVRSRRRRASARRGPVLNQASMLIDAAVDGQGVALARTTLADRTCCMAASWCQSMWPSRSRTHIGSFTRN